MSDLIDRQAAIDLLRKRLIETANNNVGFKCDAGQVFEDASERIRYWIDELPSAQAEITLESAIDYLHSIGWMQEHDRIMVEFAQPEIIRCKDCKYADEYCHCSYTTWWNSPDDFCSRAERSEEDDET